MWNVVLITIALFGLPALSMMVALILRVYLVRRRWMPTKRCAGCEYNLHLNTTGRCPECGRAISAKQRRYLQQQST